MKPQAFFEYSKKRYQTFLNKEAGLPKPWTDDPILLKYRFCNIHREDDTVTRWVRQNITFNEYGAALVGAMIIARWFNRVETLKIIHGAKDQDDLFTLWATQNGMRDWKEQMLSRLMGVKPVVTAAYMIPTPRGVGNKLQGLICCMENILPDAESLQQRFINNAVTLQEATLTLQSYPYLGPFLAYEMVTDLRHTPVLTGASDIMTWANPGPGAARGLSRVMGQDVNFYNRYSATDVAEMMKGMQELLACSQIEEFWPQNWKPWEMREVEHTLCEFDKYERVRLGEGEPKQRYAGT
jgi:hypothetical protein